MIGVIQAYKREQLPFVSVRSAFDGLDFQRQRHTTCYLQAFASHT